MNEKKIQETAVSNVPIEKEVNLESLNDTYRSTFNLTPDRYKKFRYRIMPHIIEETERNQTLGDGILYIIQNELQFLSENGVNEIYRKEYKAGKKRFCWQVPTLTKTVFYEISLILSSTGIKKVTNNMILSMAIDRFQTKDF